MVEGYRVLKNRLIHDDVICPQDADAAHLAFWERIQQLESELDKAQGDNVTLEYTNRGLVDWAYGHNAELKERIQQLESKAAALYSLAERTCGDGCHCMKENNEKCALLETDKCR